MLILTVFAFLAGIVTILSPCILPILPVILATSLTDASSRRRPYGIVVGFILSFTFFTLFLSLIVKQLGIPAESLRHLSVVVIALFGLSLLIPRFQLVLERLFARLTILVPSTAGKTGFGGGLLIGLSLGLLWTPCVGPILASVISLAITGTVTTDAFFITLAYSLGTAIPMFAVIKGGQHLFARVPWLLRNTAKIQRGFGLVMIGVAGLIYAGLDRTFQSYILTKFPQYGAGLTQFEDRAFIKDKLDEMAEPKVTLLQKGTLAPQLIVGGQWFNSDPLILRELKGNVVLVDFWTYTCINCIRTLPYLKAWDEKYKDLGLVIIGVHSPEFEFEKDISNVQEAITDFEIKYPVMQDNDFATWKAYKNRYWPAKYMIDAEGNIRYTHFGEGDYDETELAIQTLLAEAGQDASLERDNPEYKTYGRTPELYLGSARYSPTSPITREGKWIVEEEYALASPGSEMTLKYNAKAAYLVMRPTVSSAQVEVYLDQEMVDTITVDKHTLYTLVNVDSPGAHTLKLVFPDGKVELYAFTFG